MATIDFNRLRNRVTIYIAAVVAGTALVAFNIAGFRLSFNLMSLFSHGGRGWSLGQQLCIAIGAVLIVAGVLGLRRRTEPPAIAQRGRGPLSD